MADQSERRGFTPGGWTARHRCSGCTIHDDEQVGLGLEVIGPEEPMLRGEYARAADARLIAASKDLYWALRQAVDYSAQAHGPDEPWWMREARAALAKADGCTDPTT